MQKPIVRLTIAFLLVSVASHAGDKPAFSEVVIDKEFKPYLVSNPLLMEATGAKVIRVKGGGTVLLAVASTVLNDGSPKERLRAEKVCRVKAFAAMVAEKQGIQVCHEETLKERTTIIIDENGETGTSVSDLLQVTKTKVEGITKDMPVIGHWKSKDGDVFFLAIGSRLNKNGEVIQTE